MLEQALKEVTSPEAIREIHNACTAIRCMAEIINDADHGEYIEANPARLDRKRLQKARKQRKVNNASGERNIYKQGKMWYVRFYRYGENIGVKRTPDLQEAIQARDEWLAEESKQKGRT